MKKFDINKITPLHDLSWYIKWVSSFILVIAMALTGQDMYPFNMFFQFIGVFGWLIVGILWHDRALIVLNAVGLFFLGMGILDYFMYCEDCMIPLGNFI